MAHGYREPASYSWREPATFRWSQPASFSHRDRTAWPDPAPSGSLIVSETGAFIVDELGNQLAYA